MIDTMASTREKLIDAAERLFARDGFEGASLREIMRDADANPAAVHYHFGGRDGLLEAVLDRVVLPITDQRLAAFDRLRSRQPEGPLAVRDLVDAFLRADFDAIAALQRRGAGRAALVGRAYGQPSETVARIIDRQFEPVGAVYLPAFVEALAPLDAETVRWRVRWCAVGIIVALFSHADDADGPVDPTDPEASLRRAVDFVTGGLLVPAT